MTGLLAFESVVIAVNLITIDANGESTLARIWQVSAEWTIPEIIQYAKWAALTAITAVLYRVTRDRVYLVWAAAFAFAGLDDALGLHKRFGRLVSNTLESTLGIVVPSGYLELLWLGSVVALFLAALWFVRARRPAGAPRDRYTPVALALAIVYGVFGIGLDMIQTTFAAGGAEHARAESILGVIENGGELIAATLLLGFSLWHAIGVLEGRPPRRGPVSGR